MFAFTYKLNNKLEPESEDYRYVIKLLSTKATIIDFVYEHDSKGKLHIHGLADFGRKKPYLTSLCPTGYHSCFRPLKTEEDVNGWVSYMRKGNRKDNDTQIRADTEYFRTNYAFDIE